MIPEAPKRTPGSPAPARLVIPSTAKRDTAIAVAVGLAILALVGTGIFTLSKVPGTPSTNQLTGIIVTKHASGEQEKEITIGKKGLHSRETDSGYSFEVRTDPDGRVYDVPVPKVQYEMYQVGSKYSFIRPLSEQR